MPYIPDYASCPRPVMEPSSLCVSTPDRYVHNCVGLCDHICVTIMLGVAHSQPACLTSMTTINAYLPQTVSSLYIVVCACVYDQQSTRNDICICLYAFSL